MAIPLFVPVRISLVILFCCILVSYTKTRYPHYVPPYVGPPGINYSTAGLSGVFQYSKTIHYDTGSRIDTSYYQFSYFIGPLQSVTYKSTITVNDKKLEIGGSSTFRFGDYPLSDDTPVTWQVFDSVVSFMFADTAAFPQYGDILPDTVIKTNGLTISIDSSRSDSILLQILNAQGNPVLRRTCNSKEGKLFIDSSSASFLPSEPLNMYMTISAHLFCTINGYKFIFIKELNINKATVVK